MVDQTRRDLLASTAAVGIGLVPFQRSARAADAALLALRKTWQEAARALDEAERQLGLAERQYERLPEPEALYERPGDLDLFGKHVGRQQRWPGAPEGYLITHPETLWAFGAEIPDLVMRDLTDVEERRLARMAEVLTAFASWKKENRRRWRAAGIEDASTGVDAASAAEKAVRIEIANTPAVTADGIAFKVHVAECCWSGEAEEELAYRIETSDGTDEALVFSLARDLVRLARSGLLPSVADALITGGRNV